MRVECCSKPRRSKTRTREIEGGLQERAETAYRTELLDKSGAVDERLLQPSFPVLFHQQRSYASIP